MATKLYVHIGPYKTGTTSVQEHFWNNQDEYLKHGLLYPKTGVVSDKWGHRHLRMAGAFRPWVWENLVKEIETSGAYKVLVSSERLSKGLTHLAEARPFIKRYNPTMIITLRDEMALVRSMYLQTVKGHFMQNGTEGNPSSSGPHWSMSFREWWLSARHRYVYGRMIAQWAQNFSEEDVEYLLYPSSENLT